MESHGILHVIIGEIKRADANAITMLSISAMPSLPPWHIQLQKRPRALLSGNPAAGAIADGVPERTAAEGKNNGGRVLREKTVFCLLGGSWRLFISRCV